MTVLAGLAVLLTACQPTMLQLHNDYRAARDRPRLKRDSALTRAARHKVADLLRCGFDRRKPRTSHTACGRSWNYWLPKRPWLGENIAWGYPTRRAAFRAWVASKVHRQILLRREYSRVGFAHDGDVWVAAFSS